MEKGYGGLRGVFLILLCVIVAGSCAKKTVPVQAGPGAGPMTGDSTGMGGYTSDDAKWRELGLMTEPERREFLERAQSFENDDIYFDFDAYVLSENAKRTLDAKAEFLKRYPKVRVTIEGHCDERGTNEYNLALGERRANSAFQYLANSGIDPERLNTISYGEERPLAMGSTEADWAKNRRDHFVLDY